MPRAGLNQTRVIEQAEQIADEGGLANLTLAALAQRLGVRQPSLYKHIDGINGLQRSIAGRAKAELAATFDRAAVGQAGADAITSTSNACWTWALEHPRRYAAAQRASTPGDTKTDTVDRAVVEVAVVVLAGGFGPPVDFDHSFDRLAQGLEAALSGSSELPARTSGDR